MNEWLVYSLAGCTGEAGHEIVVLLLPGRHIFGDRSGEHFITLLLKRVLLLLLSLELVILGVVLLVLVEDLWILGEVVLIGRPALVSLAWGVICVLNIVIGRGYVIVVNSVFNVLKVFMSDRHTDFTEFVNHFVLGVLSAVLKVFVL